MADKTTQPWSPEGSAEHVRRPTAHDAADLQLVWSTGAHDRRLRVPHMTITEGALYAGIEQMRSGNRTGDVSAAIQNYVESRGMHVTREYTGHGVGKRMHEGPQVPNVGIAGSGLRLRPGLTIALEPMVLVGTYETRVLPDKWTVVSADGSLTAHFEHTIAVTEGDPLILTVLQPQQATV